VRMLLLLAVVLFVARKLLLPAAVRPAPAPAPSAEPGRMVRDPICQVFVPIRDAQSALSDGQKVYFCSFTCRNRFLRAS